MLFVLGLFCFPSCNSTKFLAEDEALLKNINIVFEDKVYEDASNLKYELEKFYAQRPNKNFLWIPREWFYLKNVVDGDSTIISKGLKRSVAEVPAFVDTAALVQSAYDMQNFLRNKKGYYKAEVNYDIEFYDKTAAVVYFVNTKQRYKINQVEYITRDSTLAPFIDTIQKNSLIKEGEAVDAYTFNLEQQRILQELQNRGFADFNLNYITLEGDSSDLDKRIDYFVKILNPSNKKHHKRYTFGKINVFTNYRQDQLLSKTDSVFYNGKFYHKDSRKFVMKLKSIDNNIFIKSKKLYNRDQHYKTINKLTDLSTYKFVKLSPYIDPQQDSVINYRVLLTPHVRKWVLDFGSGVFYSSQNSQGGQRLLGIALNGGLQNRNFLGGSETLSLNAETGVEFEFSQLFTNRQVRVNNYSLNLNANLEMPKMKDFLGTFTALNSLKLINETNRRTIRENTKTDISIGYSLQDIVNTYRIVSINGGIKHNYRPSDNRRFGLSQLSFGLNSYDIKPGFESVIARNPLLERSFENNLFTGLLFRDFSYIFQTNIDRRKYYFAFLGNLEISGLETFAINKAYNAFASNDVTFGINSFDFANFVKLELDGRFYRTVSKKASIASRLILGIATPYADNTVVPYIKQFFIGGPSSIRAWQTRELGAGSHQPEAIAIGQQFYQAADIKIEYNLEYRFDIFWIVEGAAFIDAGNIWTLENDVNRVGSQFTSAFLNDLAVGVGWGVRWDFTYFNIRFDFGYRIRDPYLEIGKSSKWRSPFGQGIFGNINLAINYPF